MRRSLPSLLASLVTSLMLLSACYDFSLPDEGSTGAGPGSGGAGSGASGTGAASSSGGAGVGGNGTGGSGVGGPTSYPPPCDAYDCSGCVACTLAFFDIDPTVCEAYDGCVTSCGGNQSCEAGCQANNGGLGLVARSTLDNQCGAICAGPVPCRP
jgi:hypothetical protein